MLVACVHSGSRLLGQAANLQLESLTQEPDHSFTTRRMKSLMSKEKEVRAAASESESFSQELHQLMHIACTEWRRHSGGAPNEKMYARLDHLLRESLDSDQVLDFIMQD
jgi:hypothetical protein